MRTRDRLLLTEDEYRARFANIEFRYYAALAELQERLARNLHGYEVKPYIPYLASLTPRGQEIQTAFEAEMNELDREWARSIGIEL